MAVSCNLKTTILSNCWRNPGPWVTTKYSQIHEDTMRIRSVIGAIAGMFIVISTAPAQVDTTPPPPIFQVTTVEVLPGTMMSFRTGFQKQAAAAAAAGLPSAEVGWWLYSSDNRAVMVRPRSRDAMFQNLGVAAAIRKANPAADSAIGAAFGEAEVQMLSNEIIQLSEDLSYTPAGDPIEPGGARVMDLTIAPGQGAAFRKAIGDMIGLMRELKYPYPANLYRVRYGEARTQWVIFFDTRENFHGAKSFNRLFEANPTLAEKAGPIYQAFLKTLTGMKTTEYQYEKALSFPPGS